MGDEGVRAYRVVAKIKNNRLWSAIVATFPEVKTQSDAARALGVGPSIIGGLLNMTWWPGNKRGAWAPRAQRIAAAVRDTPEYLFDGELYGRKPERPLALEFDLPALQGVGMLPEVATPEEVLERQQIGDAVADALASLSGQQRAVLEQRFGLIDGGQEATVEEVAGRLGVSRPRVWQIEQAALGKLRSRAVAPRLLHYTEGGPRPLPRAPVDRQEPKPKTPARPTCAGAGQKPKPRTTKKNAKWGIERREGACRACGRRYVALTKAGTLAGHKALPPEEAAKAEGWTYWSLEALADMKARYPHWKGWRRREYAGIV